MFAPVRHIAIGMCLLGSLATAAAQSANEDEDLKRIPHPAENARANSDSSAAIGSGQRIRIEDALTGWDTRILAVPMPTVQPTWQNRLSVDADIKLPVSESLTFSFSDRLNLFAGSVISSLSRANVENDLREVYLSDALTPKTYIEAGRVNLKEGVAYGYNPTDFFKTRTAVQVSSIDPSVGRENRLGVVMIKAQQLFDSGSVSAAFAPKLADPSAIPTSAPASFDGAWERTNAENRGLVAASWSGSSFNPQVLAFHDSVGTHWGASLSHVLGDSAVGYLEWAGVREPSLVARALDFGERTGVFPANLTQLEHISERKHFSNDLSTGITWTSSANLTLNLEYHYHASGLDDSDVAHVFAMGTSGPRGAAQFWYLRQYAADQQEPFTRREWFARADWQDVIPSKLNLGAVAFVAQSDGSALGQVYARYFPSRIWTISAYLGVTAGSKNSAFGSLPWHTSGVVQIVRYF